MGTLIPLWKKRGLAYVRRLQDGTWYDLEPPVTTGDGLVFRRARCQYQVPGAPNEYSLEGVPDNGTKMKAFVLRFTEKGRIVPRKSANQLEP